MKILVFAGACAIVSSMVTAVSLTQTSCCPNDGSLTSKICANNLPSSSQPEQELSLLTEALPGYQGSSDANKELLQKALTCQNFACPADDSVSECDDKAILESNNTVEDQETTDN